MTPPDATNLDQLSTIIAAAGVLGTACFGIVEALKWTALGSAGFGRIVQYLGPELLGALQIAYGPEYRKLLVAQYREDSQQQTAIAKTLRQGVRLGLTATNAAALAEFLGTVQPQALLAAVNQIAAGAHLKADDRGAIGRYEAAVDARIDSALSRAKDVYLGTIRMAASVLAIVLSEVAEVALGPASHLSWVGALLVGIVAVPLAPVANDLVAALQAATKALRS